MAQSNPEMPNAKRAQIYAKYDGHCAYCGRKITFKDMDVDHIKPKSRGGSSELSNLNPSCRQCNRMKAALTIEGFRKEIASQIKIIKDNIALAYGIIDIHPKKKVKFFFETFTQ